MARRIASMIRSGTLDMFSDFQGRCMTRTAPEEANLCAYWDDQDVTNAEFVRTYMSKDFPGQSFVRRLEAEHEQVEVRSVPKILPTQKIEESGNNVRHYDDLYGFRGTNPKVYYVSPWEFIRYWEVLEVPTKKENPDTKTSSDNTFRAISPKRKSRRADSKALDSAKQGSATHVNNPFPFEESDDLIRYPEMEGEINLRNAWHKAASKRTNR